MRLDKPGALALLSTVFIVALVVGLLAYNKTPINQSGMMYLEEPNLERPYARSMGMPCYPGSLCIMGLACLNGYCQKAPDYVLYPTEICERSSQCSFGYQCINNYCQLPRFT